MRVYHHNDLDGRCAAAIVISAEGPYLDTVELDYKDEVPLDLDKNETVFIVDFSFKPEIMAKLLEITKNVVVLSDCKATWRYCRPDEPMPQIIEMCPWNNTWMELLEEDLCRT